MSTLHVLHTNDFHNHLTSAQAAFIRATRDALPHSLLLDAGDAVSAGNIGVRPGGEPILTLMSDTGYDAMTLGNREFHIADSLLRLKVGKAAFPILSANMRWREDKGEPLPTIPYIVKTLPDGLRVAVLGLTLPMVTTRMAARAVSAFLFDDPINVARAQIALLRSQADILIALTHIGLREDERLAAACPELDVIIGGHSHVVLPAPQMVASVPIAQAGWYGHYLGHLTLETRPGAKAVVSGHLLPLKEQG